MTPAPEKEVAQFADAAAFDAWLAAHHADHPGIRMKIAKKGSPVATVTYDQALDSALRYGWIDGQKGSLNEHFYLQVFVKRRPRSMWSKRNVGKANDLIERGLMEPAGQAEVDSAKADGRWDRAYEGSSGSTLPPDLVAALNQNPDAAAFYATISAANRFAIYFRIHGAKRPETRARRIADIVAMLAREETIH